MPRRNTKPTPIAADAAEARRQDGPKPQRLNSTDPRRSRETVVRRGSREQGRALEALGHAVEYLVDSRLFTLDEAGLQSDSEAIQIMMRLSRAVFAECPEVISLRKRVRMWLVERLASPAEFNPTR